MPWGSGSYTKGNAGTGGWAGDAAGGIGIEAGRHDTQDNDFAAGINQCLNKDGSNSATGNLNLGGTNKIISLAAGTAATDAATLAQVQSGASSYLGVTGGTSTAFTVTATPTIAALTTGAQYTFKANAANGAAATLKIDGTAATTMQRQGTALAGNEFKANDFVTIIYDGSNFQIINIATAPLFVDRTNNRVGVGTTAPASVLDVQATTAEVRATQFSNNTTPAKLLLYKSKSGTIGTSTIVADGDELGQISFLGANGTGYTEAGSIVVTVSGTPGGSGDMPGRMSIRTSSDGSGTPTERVAITAAGRKEFINGDVSFHNTAISSGAGTNALKYNTTTGVVTYDASSALIKDNIVDCPYGIDAVLAMQPRKYFRTDDQKDELGFIADEMALAIPELVSYCSKSWFTKNEQDTELVPGSIAYEKLTAVLCKAIQDLNAKVETLEARVAALEA